MLDMNMSEMNMHQHKHFIADTCCKAEIERAAVCSDRSSQRQAVGSRPCPPRGERCTRWTRPRQQVKAAELHIRVYL